MDLFRHTTELGSHVRIHVYLLCDYCNQGHTTKFSTNLTNKMVDVSNSFPTNHPECTQICCLGNVQLDCIDNMLENYLYSFKFVDNFVGWLGWSSDDVTTRLHDMTCKNFGPF